MLQYAKNKGVQIKETPEVAATPNATTLICSGCELEKICGTYTTGNQEYIVCYDCSNEFITHHEDIAIKQIFLSFFLPNNIAHNPNYVLQLPKI